MKVKAVIAAVVLVVLGGCGALAMAGYSAMSAVVAASSGGGDAVAVRPGGLSAKVPAELVPWIERASALCQPPLTPALLAAQLEQESNFDTQAVNASSGATGVAQLMPFNFGLLRDEDGNGRASALDGPDAIMAQGRLMCSMVPRLSVYSGTQLQEFLLASYNAGPFAVLPSVCAKATVGGECQAKIPPYPETENYVKKIMANMASFVAPGGGGAIAAPGAWIHPVPGNPPAGGTFHQVGSHWRMCGWHTGYDYVVPIGTNVMAVHSGTVVHAGWGGEPGGTGSAYGNQVIVDHGAGLRTYYDHLSGIGVTQGQAVTTGQVMGVSGATGNVTGPHLHFELTQGASGMPTCGQFADPYAFLSAHANDAAPAAEGASGSALGNAAVAAAKTQLGVTYVYGGGDLTGPSFGGFDCSSLVRYAWYQASGGRVVLPRVTTDQISATATIDKADLQPGDLIFYQTALPGDWSHVGMYIGGGQMIHAPHTGDVVRIVSITSGYYASKPAAYRRVSS